ncbi:MAG: hypothetical protein AAF654_06840 [Myxococcota bacterium]
MDFLTTHARNVEEETEALVQKVRATDSYVREPLRKQLRKHREFLRANIEARPTEVLSLYGVDASRAELPDTGAIRDRAIARLDALGLDIRANRPEAVVEFLRDNAAVIRAGIELCAQVRARNAESLSSAEAQTALAADTAFHLHRYIVEMLKRIFDGFAPRTAESFKPGVAAFP